MLAVDWSGRAKGAERRIWLAEVRAGRLVRLENGRKREELVSELIGCAEATTEIVVGLDFAFSFPGWFLRERGLGDASALWRTVASEGESWLARCEPPFWGRPGKRRPEFDALRPWLRRTEGERPPQRGISPKSVFQIGGAGAVGTGSLRGMAELARLSSAGFAIWPFDAPRTPLVLGIYPRHFTPGVNKSRRAARELFLANRWPGLSREWTRVASASEDAFDAAVSALTMDAHADELVTLDDVRDPLLRLEGRIWAPQVDPCSNP